MSPLHESRGATVDSNQGVTRKRMKRETRTNSFFAENRFSFSKLMITPGFRIENINQSIDEKINADSGSTRNEMNTVNVPLFAWVSPTIRVMNLKFMEIYLRPTNQLRIKKQYR